MSKYYPVNNEEDYAYFVEGRNRYGSRAVPHSRWRIGVNGYPPQYYRNHQPCSSGVIYCNPQFSTDSSQATLQFESESDDAYGRRGYGVYSPRMAPKYSYYVKEPYPSHPVSKSTISSKPSMYYDYGDVPRSVHYREVIPEEELEPEPKSILKNKNVARQRSTNLRSIYSTERMIQNINSINKYNANGRKLNRQEVHMITERLKSRQHSHHNYVWNKSRFLDRSYEHAAKMLKEAQTKAVSSKTEKPSDFYDLEEPSKTEKKLSRRQIAVASDRHGHFFVGSQKLVQQVSPLFTVVNGNPCQGSEERQEVSEGSQTKPLDVEQPVKLQKENCIFDELCPKPVIGGFSQRNEPLTRRAKGSIRHTTKRIRRPSKRPLGVATCAKVMQKFIEETQTTMLKNCKVPEQTDVSTPAPQPSAEKSHSVKSNLKIEVCDMLTKLEEIQDLLNRRTSDMKTETNIVHVQFSDTSERTSDVAISPKSGGKHVTYNLPIPESDEYEASQQSIKCSVKSHSKLPSKISTQSAIKSHVSNMSKKLHSNKSYDNEATDAQIFQDIFQSEEEIKTKPSSKIPVIKKRRDKQITKHEDCDSASIISSTSTVHQFPRRKLGIPKNSSSSVVTVFPVPPKTIEKRQTSSTVRKRRVGKKRNVMEKCPESSSDNLDNLKITKRKAKFESILPDLPTRESILTPSVLRSFNNALYVIVSFFFRYFKNLFIF